MKAVKNIETEEVLVEYFTCHNNTVNLCHLIMPENIRSSIAMKLQEGVSVDKIIDQIRDTILGLGRESLATKQDIRSIARSFNVEGISKHPSDAISANLWVQELRSAEQFGPVVLYKPQGIEPVTNSMFGKDDFVLIIKTPFQRDMMRKFGNCAICIDSTHGTNQYSFPLTTIIVIDEYGKGVPIAWMVSNHEDTNVLTKFFKHLKERIEPEWFMSDDAPQYFNAWQVCDSVINLFFNC